MTHEKREVRGGQWGKSTAVPCLSTLTWFVPPSVNFWLQYQRDTFPCTDTLKPTTTSGKTEDVSVTTAFPIRSLGIFPTSYFVSLLSLSLSLPYFFFFFISFTSCFSVYFFLLFSFLSLSLSLSFSTVGRFISASVKILRGRDCIVKKQNEGTTGCINFRKLFLPRCNVRIKGTWRLIRKCPRDRASPSFL